MNRKKFREGLRDGLPIALGYLAVSFGIGISCYNSSIGKTRIKMQTFRIIDENPSHENAASKLVLAAVRFFILAVLIRFKQHSAPPYEATFLPFFSLPLSARRCAMI